MGVYNQLEPLAALERMSILPTGQMLTICTRLHEMRLIICEPSRVELYRKILLNISADDIHYALQEF